MRGGGGFAGVILLRFLDILQSWKFLIYRICFLPGGSRKSTYTSQTHLYLVFSSSGSGIYLFNQRLQPIWWLGSRLFSSCAGRGVGNKESGFLGRSPDPWLPTPRHPPLSDHCHCSPCTPEVKRGSSRFKSGWRGCQWYSAVGLGKSEFLPI